MNPSGQLWKRTLVLGPLILAVMLAGCDGARQNSQVEEEPTREALLQEIDALKAELAELKVQQAKPAKTVSPDTALLSAEGFSDVDEDVPHYDKINDLAALGVFEGVSGEFKPYEPVTRSQFVRWLHRAHNAVVETTRVKEPFLMAPHFTPRFKDLSPEHPDYKYIQSLAYAGLPLGYDDGTFRPDQPITREEMLGLKVAIDFGGNVVADEEMVHLHGFSDYQQVDKRFSGAINYAYENITRPFGQIKALKPKDPLLRYEAAAVLWKFYRNEFARTAQDALKEQARASG